MAKSKQAKKSSEKAKKPPSSEDVGAIARRILKLSGKQISKIMSDDPANKLSAWEFMVISMISKTIMHPDLARIENVLKLASSPPSPPVFDMALGFKDDESEDDEDE